MFSDLDGGEGRGEAEQHSVLERRVEAGGESETPAAIGDAVVLGRARNAEGDFLEPGGIVVDPSVARSREARRRRALTLIDGGRGEFGCAGCEIGQGVV